MEAEKSFFRCQINLYFIVTIKFSKSFCCKSLKVQNTSFFVHFSKTFVRFIYTLKWTKICKPVSVRNCNVLDKLFFKKMCLVVLYLLLNPDMQIKEMEMTSHKVDSLGRLKSWGGYDIHQNFIKMMTIEI
jgi:hypothetical protein